MLFILLFFGSESIPTIARTLGRGVRQFKDATTEIKTEIKKSADKIAEEAGIENKNHPQLPQNNTAFRLDQQFEEDTQDKS